MTVDKVIAKIIWLIFFWPTLYRYYSLYACAFMIFYYTCRCFCLCVC